jgi:hypothetical protein
MLQLFCAFSASWSDRIMAATSYIALDNLGYKYQSAMSKIFLDAGDTDLAVQPWLTSAWMNYVERPPFNFKGFNHWRNMRKPYNPENISEIPDYFDSDNLLSNVQEMNRSLIKGEATKTWPYAFSLKVLFAGIPDLHAPLHASEYFSSDFPDGNRNGKLFNIIVDGKKTNLYDFYETGCGLTPLTSEINESFITEVKELVDDILEQYSFRPSAFSYQEIQRWHDISYSDSVSIYKSLKPGDTITDKQIATCQQNTMLQIIKAAQWIYSFMQKTTILEFASHVTTSYATATPLATTEVMAWSLAAILAPFTALLIWKKHCSKP